MIIASFSFFLLMFIVIGVLAVRHRRQTTQDYLLASHNIKPWLVALSAVATNNSGYMFVGQIGFTYEFGLQSIWLMIGWLAGDFLMSLFIHRRLRTHAADNNALSFAGAISKWHGVDYKHLRRLGGLITLMFLGTYAGAQLNAGSKALHVLFGWDYAAGAVIGAIIVLLYCFAGGIRASIWTDAAQSFVMIAAMVLMLVMSLTQIGGWDAFVTQLHGVSDTYMDWFPQDMTVTGPAGPFLFVLGWFCAGMGVIGQPHIMVRFMALDDPAHIARVRAYYYGWFALFYGVTIMAAMCARLLLPDVANFDAELALPTLALELLPGIFVGLVLAGLFAATMSTADSQILSCTAAITHDLVPSKLSGYMANKLATITVTLIALAMALAGNDSVFSLVLIAWSALASAFGPLLIVYAFRQQMHEWLAIAMMFGGVSAMLAWRHFELNDITYEIVPGLLTGLAIFAIGKTFDLAQTVPRKTPRKETA